MESPNKDQRGAIILGASSGVGRACAEALAKKGYDLLLVARAARDLDSVGRDLTLRFGVNTKSLECDLGRFEFSAEAFLEEANQALPYATVLVVTAGVADDSDTLTLNDQLFNSLISVNFLNPAKLLKAFAHEWERQKRAGTILVCSSIAAGVPRSRNMAYSAAKAGLESYCRSLQHQLSTSKISVQIIRLGYVDTAMTVGKKLLFPVVSAHDVAEVMARSIESPKRLRYVPWYWCYIVALLRALPWSIYARLKF